MRQKAEACFDLRGESSKGVHGGQTRNFAVLCWAMLGEGTALLSGCNVSFVLATIPAMSNASGDSLTPSRPASV